MAMRLDKGSDAWHCRRSEQHKEDGHVHPVQISVAEPLSNQDLLMVSADKLKFEMALF